jgi:catechol-2,3-dioxygenase
MSSGGYHHHVATNVWDSRDAGPAISTAPGFLVLDCDQ